MKLKNSFFNKTIFKKNVTLYWPIWGIYTVIAVIMQPFLLWLFNNMSYYANEYTDKMKFRDLMDTLGFSGYVVLIAFAALLTGMALFSYMYNSKSANMIHSLPVDRTQLFGTALISGWTFLVVPLFVTALLSTFMCIIYTIPGVGYVWLWFVHVAALAFIAFSIVSICALFTGHIVVLPMYAFVVNVISWVVYFLANAVITTFGFGVTELGENAEKLAGIFCPIQCFADNLRWEYDYSDTGMIIGATLDGSGYVVIYLILAVVFYLSAYVIYRKRKIEQAGDFLTVNWVKPIFRGVVAVLGGIYGAMIVREVLIDTRLGCGIPLFVGMLLLIGGICYFAADMFIKKSFHVFKKRNWIGCGISSVVVFVAFFSMYGLAEQYEREVPNVEDLIYAEIRSGYEITLYGEEAATIIEIQKEILEKADYIESRVESGDRYYNSVAIRYQPKDGPWIYRRYPLSSDDENLKSIYDKILALEADEENYLVNTFGADYANVSTFYSGTLSCFFIEPEDREKEEFYPDSSYNSINLDSEKVKELYYALIADVKAGTLMKYNVNDGKGMYEEIEGDIMYYGFSEVTLSIEYQIPNSDESAPIKEYGETVDDYKDIKYVHLTIGPDCENVVNKLVELGIIESVEHIWWGSIEDILMIENIYEK